MTMVQKLNRLILLIALFSIPAVFHCSPTEPPPVYPITRTVDLADTLFGKIIRDPYRWLEYTDSVEVQRWTDEQNRLTRSYLDKLPQRAKLKARFEEIWNYPKTGMPIKRVKRYFFSKNDGLQNHNVIYAANNPADTPQVAIDPNVWSEDGTVAMDYWEASKDGRYIAYGRSLKGAERGVMRIRDIEKGEDLPDSITDTSYPSVAWLNDNSGFYYSRNPSPGSVPPGDENYYEKVYFHRLGSTMADDRLIYERPDIKELGLSAQLSEDGKHLLIYGYLGSSRKNEVYHKALSDNSAIKPIISGFEFAYNGVAIDSNFYVMTNEHAANGKIILINLNNPDRKNWKTIVPESNDILENFYAVNGHLILLYLHNAYSIVKVFRPDGGFVNEIKLPTLGSVKGVSGRWNDEEIFIDFHSFTFPYTVYRYDLPKNELIFHHRNPVKIDTSGYETKQVWYNSKDGTPISMFVVHKQNIKLDGKNPTLLYGYGGFTATMTPYFSSTIFVLLENGFVYAMPNLRGGGEYGDEWHKAGMLEKKQNVFDDFIAAAEWLIDKGYTSPRKLAISGGSNGGLLVGAVMVQRPELFRAVICGAPLLDMIRYHLFNIARYWIPEYGSAEDSTQLDFLLAYSPYHNIRPNIAYPAALFQSGETDWRTHPLHARKMVAALQAATTGAQPILLDMERKTGHGWGMPLSLQLEKYADEYAFLFWQLGIK